VYDGEVETKNYTPTKTGIVLGTPQYLSPEQARGEKGPNVDGRADLYALGVMLYEMITSELPFQSDNAIGLLMHHLGTAPIPPHVRRSELNIPEAVSAVVMTALEKDRNNRFQNGEEFAQAMIAARSSAVGHEEAAEKASTNTFSTAALAAAASGVTAEPRAGLTRPSPAATSPKIKAAPAPRIAPTKVMGSTGVTVAPTQIKKKKKMLWIATGAGAALLALVIWAMLPSQKSRGAAREADHLRRQLESDRSTYTRHPAHLAQERSRGQPLHRLFAAQRGCDRQRPPALATTHG